MDSNYIDIIAKNIVFFRKRLRLTQEELASKFSISFQAVSKWESGSSIPDINFLPLLASTFNITIDELFQEQMEDNIITKENTITIVVYDGKQVINQFDATTTPAKVVLSGKPKDLISYANLEVKENLSVEGGVTCHGKLTADRINCGGLTCKADMVADQVNCGGLTVGGNIVVDRMSSGGATIKGIMTADKISCGGLICASDLNGHHIECKDKISVQGNISCQGEIRANVINGIINKDNSVGVTFENNETNDIKEKLDDLQDNYDELSDDYNKLQDDYEELDNDYQELKSQFDELKYLSNNK